MASPSTALEARQSLANALAGIEGLTAYPEPPETVRSPAAIVGPGAPYREPSTICREAMELILTVAVPRSAGLDQLDALLDQTLAATQALPWLTWVNVEQVGIGLSVGGTEHIAAIARFRAELI